MWGTAEGHASPKSRAQRTTYLIVKSILWSCPNLGHSLWPCLIAKYSLTSHLTMKPGLWPHLNVESSHCFHLLRKHTLKPHLTRNNCRAWPATLPNHRIQLVTTPSQGKD